MGGTEQDYVKEAFNSNWIAPLGPNVTGFETDLEHYLGENKSVACLSSGTAAIHLALVQLGVGQGDEIICQSFTFCGSANPIIYQGAIPIFVDSEKETWNMCPEQLELAITDRIKKGKTPKAIILVHLYGMPAKLDEIVNIANKYGIPLIEDAAEALGSEYKGRKCGTFGLYSVLSFNGNKIITTSGGGALVCSSKADKDQTIFYATQARDKAPHYEHTNIGYNYRMSNISAGIGRGQMEVLDNHVYSRQRMNEFYQQLFDDIDGVEVFSEQSSYCRSNHWLSCILFSSDSKVSRQQLKDSFESDNIESRALWKPMHMQPIFAGFPTYLNGVSESLFRNGLCLPSGSNLTDGNRDRITKVIRDLF